MSVDTNEKNVKINYKYKLSINSGLILISNLTDVVTKQHLYEIFSAYGDIKSVILNKNKAFIEFNHYKDSIDAIKYMNNAYLDGNYISIKKLLPLD